MNTFRYTIGITIWLLSCTYVLAMDKEGGGDDADLKPAECLSVIWSPDAMHIAAVLKVHDEQKKTYHAIGIFDAKTHNNITNLFSTKDGFIKGMPEGEGADVPIHYVVYNKNVQQQNIAVARSDGRLYVYSGTLDKLLRWCACPHKKITSISWGKEEFDCVEMLAAASAPDDGNGNSHVTLLRNVTQNSVGEIQGISYSLGLCAQPSVSMSSDGMFAVADSRHERVNIYNLEGEWQKALSTPYAFTPHAVTHTPSGDIIVAGQPLSEGGKNMYLFPKGDQLKGMPINFGDTHVCYSPMSGLNIAIDTVGTRIALSDPHAQPNNEGIVSIYDLKTKERIAQFSTRGLHYAALSPDGSAVVIGSHGGWSAEQIESHKNAPEEESKQKSKKPYACLVS